ncbi:MAG: N-acetyltransferase [Cyanobacteria bacterium NC_groundwater_1444_Ag_S-0.65um_54_12]|nr:N-acetyltransferase [Cyanobacteria bacterium NC_groundwater_1444_Ag_S-0.65um_54_12]
MFKIILGSDAELRLLELHHADELFVLTDSNRKHLRQWLPWVDGNSTVNETKGFIEGSRKRYAANTGYDAGIWYQGQLAGVLGCFGVSLSNRFASIGYWLGEEYQGHGLITRACKVVLDHAFGEWNLNRVEIRCAMDNRKSRAIPERLGFTNEGMIRDGEWLYDHFVDHIIYGMLAKDWPSNPHGASDRRASGIEIREVHSGKGHLCEQTLRALPDWFGIEQAIVNYTADVESMPTFGAFKGDQAVGFLSLKIHSEATGEIYVMGIRPEFHRLRIGGRLVQAVEDHLRKSGHRYLTVKTLSPARENHEYEATRRFYASIGFASLEEFPTLWGEANPCLMMAKSL